MLLIEDDDDDALIVSDLLADAGSEVRLVHERSLADGLARVSTDLECALLDLHLPDASGIDSVGRLRAAAPWLAVIVLTGLADEAAGEAAVEAGAQDYLVKGRVDGDLLARAIRYAVGRRHAEEAESQLRLAEIRADENARLERALVPHPIVENPALWVASHYLPGRERALIGGDFYDAVEVAGRLHVVIGDVSGRGPDEAALGAALRIAWRALTLSATPGDRTLNVLHALVAAERRDERTFATLCALELDPRAGSLTVRRAGHPAPMLLHDDARPLPLDSGGPPIGMFAQCVWPAQQVALPADWAVLLYTDGITEARDGVDRLLGEEGLRRLVARRLAAGESWRADPSRLLGAVIDEARIRHGEPFSDDVALLAVGVR